MSLPSPVPAPRTNAPIGSGGVVVGGGDSKKPVPLPRQMVKNKTDVVHHLSDHVNHQQQLQNEVPSGLKDRVRSLSNTSKQIKDELAGKVHETKKAAIEGTMESLRRIRKRFTMAGIQDSSINNNNLVPSSAKEPNPVQKSASENCIPLSNDVFGSIRFKSPISKDASDDQHIYNNVSPGPQSESSDEESISLPPPKHPPPPLPLAESLYDQPQSLASGSTGSDRNTPPHFRNPYDYEAVFPTLSHSSDTESSSDARSTTCNTLDSKVDIVRSNSWCMYDSVEIPDQIKEEDGQVEEASQENFYDHVGDATTGILNPTVVYERQNSLYENHEIINPSPCPPVPERKKPRESVLAQFDPLIYNNNRASKPNNTDINMLENLLEAELCSSVSNVFAYDSWSISNESESEEYLNPPTPPARFDSLPEESNANSKTNWFTVDATSSNSKGGEFNRSSETRRSNNWFRDQINELKKKVPDSLNLKAKEKCLERPTLVSKGSVKHKGMVYKVTTRSYEDFFSEFSVRWSVLESGTFVCYSDNTCDSVRESFTLDSILSLQVLMEQKYKMDEDDIYCFELTTTGKNRGGYIYGTKNQSERRVWVQKLADSLTSKFSAKITSDFTRFGWAYVREGVSGSWAGAWICLSKRKLYYATDNAETKSLDLRKARCIALQPLNEDCPKTNDKGPNMLVDCPNGVLYLRMWTARETKMWCHVLVVEGHYNGALLDQQQLTKDDVPVIVEKCINFIYAHGSMVEGIYRRSGSETSIADILSQFRKDAWAFTLTIDKYSEHDVANALKRFFRDVPEPLLASNKRQYLCQVALLNDQDEKVRMYRAVLEQLPPVTYNTIRKLLGHLHFIQSQSDRNLMNIDNLAAIWAPALMHHEDNNEKYYTQKQLLVIKQLIELYRSLFPETSDELKKEKLMLEVLERCAKSPQNIPGKVNSSGDLRVWVYLNNKEGITVNVTLGPQKTAHELCSELVHKMSPLEVHELQLEEQVLGGQLTRPIHYSEKVLEVVLRWGYWDEADRKDNCLVLTTIKKYREFISESTSMAISGDLKYADSKSKSFKNYMFDFSQAKLCYYKDKNCTVKLKEWNIEDIIWYLGHEIKRNPQTRWSITFILKKLPPKRTKASPWFGHIISGIDPAQRAAWLGAMLKAEHHRGLSPPPIHVNLITG